MNNDTLFSGIDNIVDIEFSTNNPIAIDYLDAIGMPLNSIKEVVLTH